MGRRPGDPGGGGSRASLCIVVAAFSISCTLAYMVICQSRRPSGVPSVSSVVPGWTSGAERKETVGGGVEEECCRGVENMEFWGTLLENGAYHTFNTSRECCLACKAMCRGLDGPCPCNSWVFCGDRERCRERFGECWLKHQKDVLVPELHDSEKKLIWTSGLIVRKGEAIVGFETDYGTIHIELFPDCAPHSVAYIIELLKLNLCFGCQIHRAEGRGHSWDSKGNHIADASFGPPYAMIQGTLEAEGFPFKKIPVEICPTIRRGSVAWVGSGPEFFISLANHDEWQSAYKVFGYVLPEDMEIAEKIAKLPTKPDVWSHNNVLVLEKPVHLRLKRITNGHGDLHLDSRES